MNRLKLACVLMLVAAALRGADKPLLQKPPAKEISRTNPYEGSQSAERAGQKLFLRECSDCHGEHGEGSGRSPALASPALDHFPAGTIFWILRNGSLRHGMPSFAHLPAQQRWQIVTYLKSLSGQTLRK
jgi:mono/diheme cytochrome c family protein